MSGGVGGDQSAIHTNEVEGVDDQARAQMHAQGPSSMGQENERSLSHDGSSNPESSSCADSSLNILARNMFQKTADYLQGELLLIKEDYKLLENVNHATAAKYADMRQVSGNVITNLQELNLKFQDLAPILKQIDQIEDSVAKLEQAAYKLDNYSKRLEAKFKMLEQRR